MTAQAPRKPRAFEDERDFLFALYPMHYLDEVDVLHHLFFVFGNGYTWIGGGLLSPFDGDVDTIWANRKAAMEQYLAEMGPLLKAYPDHAYAADVKRKLAVIDDRAAFAAVCREVERAYRAKRESAGIWQLRAVGWSRALFMQTGFAPIYGVPDDVTPSWFAAIERAFQAIDDGRLRIVPADGRWIARARAAFEVIRAERDDR